MAMTQFQALKEILRLALPILVGNLSYALLGISDTVMAGMAGTADLAGVAVGGSFFFPAAMFMNGLMSTLQPQISRHRGANAFHKIPGTHLTAVIVTVGFSLLLMALLLFLALCVLKLDSDARMDETARIYVLAVALAMPCSALYFACRAYCEAMGHTRATLYFGFVALFYNIPLNYIFIFGKLGAPALGGAGCGVATLISITLSLITFILYIRAVPLLYENSLRFVKSLPTLRELKDFTLTALPLGISASVECSCFTVIAVLLSPLGPLAVSSHSVAMSITSFIFNLPLSLGIATSIAVGYNIGKNALPALRDTIRAAYKLAFLGAFVNILILLTLRHTLCSLYTDDAAVAAFAAALLIYSALNQISGNTQTVQAFILRGFKDSATIFKSTLLSFYLIALPLGFTLCYGYLGTAFTGPAGFWAGIFAGLSFAALYYRRRVLHHYRALKAQIANTATGA